MLTFIHLADLHLDGLHKKRGQMINRAIKESFQLAIDDAIKKRVDLLMISGDLFDGHHLTFATESMLIACFLRLQKAGIRVYYALGNHDHGGRVRRRQWPENVHLFTEPKTQIFEQITSKGHHYRVVGAGYDAQWIQEDCSLQFPPRNDERWTLGILHTGLSDERYMPTSVEKLKALGYDYLALGHIHQRRRIGENLAYAGSIVGLDETEVGPKGGFFGRLDHKGLTLEARDYCTLVRGTCHLFLPAGVMDVEQVEALMREALKKEKGRWVLLEVDFASRQQEALFTEDNRTYLEESLADALDLMALDIRKGGLEEQAVKCLEGSWPHLLKEKWEKGDLVEHLMESAQIKELLETCGEEKLETAVKHILQKAVKSDAL